MPYHLKQTEQTHECIVEKILTYQAVQQHQSVQICQDLPTPIKITKKSKKQI